MPYGECVFDGELPPAPLAPPPHWLKKPAVSLNLLSKKLPWNWISSLYCVSGPLGWSRRPPFEPARRPSSRPPMSPLEYWEISAYPAIFFSVILSVISHDAV